jgi:hypothetical protein
MGKSGGSTAAHDGEMDRINKVNDQSTKSYKDINEALDKTVTTRKELDEKMMEHYKAMRPLCQEYMKHRAELLGLAGQQCIAAQGRLNGEDLLTFDGPRGCKMPERSGSLENEPGTPLILHESQCQNGQKELLCTERLAQLERGDPAPGEDFLKPAEPEKLEPGEAEHRHEHLQEQNAGTALPNAKGEGPSGDHGMKGEPEEEDNDADNVGPSMDAEVRKWCHPAHRLNVPQISEDLSRGVLAPKADEGELEMD